MKEPEQPEIIRIGIEGERQIVAAAHPNLTTESTAKTLPSKQTQPGCPPVFITFQISQRPRDKPSSVKENLSWNRTIIQTERRSMKTAPWFLFGTRGRLFQFVRVMRDGISEAPPRLSHRLRSRLQHFRRRAALYSRQSATKGNHPIPAEPGAAFSAFP